MPSPTLTQLWAVCVVLAAVLYAVVFPLGLVFEDATPVPLTVLLWTALLVFVADLPVRIHRGGDGQPSGFDREPRWLLVFDVLAVIPLSIVWAGAWAFELGPGILGLLKLVRAGLCMRQWRLVALGFSHVLTLAFAGVWLLLLVHWICSGWLALRGITAGSGLWVSYLDSLYWTVETLSTVGYGDVTPEGTAEKLYAIGTMVAGIAVIGYVIGQIASLLSRKAPARVLFEENIDRLAQAVRHGHLPPDVQERIHDYYSYMWRQRLGYDETDFLASLPHSLREEVSRHLKKDVLEKIDLFRGAEEDFVSFMALRLQPQILTPGDFVFRQGEPGQRMYFVVRGELDVLRAGSEEAVATLKAGDFFGEIALFLDEPRSASVRARTYCDVYALSKEAFRQVFERFPESVAQIETRALARRRRDSPEGRNEPS